MTECACGQQLGLWKTPVDNPADSRAGDSMLIQEINLLNRAESVDADLVDALMAAVGLLDARVESLELRMLELLAIVEAPLTPAERIQRVREIRDGI